MKLKSIILLFLIFTLNSCQTRFVKSFNNLRFTSQPEPVIENVSVALVLSGGGSRSIAQIGVIEVLEENNIPIDLIVGTSGGSIIGALYADKPDANNLKKVGLSFKRSDLAEISFEDAIEGTRSLRGGLDGSVGEKFLDQNLSAKYFNELKIPFIAVATDVSEGKTVILKRGKISPAVRASCAIPGLFSPVELYGMLLVDGGVTAPLPIEVAKTYNPELIIAIDVSSPVEKDNVTNMFDLVSRTANISYNVLIDLQGKQADILIKPDLKGAGLFDDHLNEELYLLGRAEALSKIGEIKLYLQKKAREKLYSGFN